MRNLTKTIVTMSLLAPMAAHSLGVGEIKLHSALNQKLNAEIALSLSAGEYLDDIHVTLATSDQFEKLGITWSYFISKLKFKPIVKSNGKVVIQVTSDLVLQEPILDFLLEVSWPNGEIFKEYTVLVDPPVVYQKNITNTPSVPAVKQKKNIKRSAPAPVKQNDFSSLAVKGEYGPTSRSDSLWTVAKKINKYSDVSVEQMMMALHKANPTAFYKNNVNALMEGKTLKIPGKAEIVKLSKKQAHAQFQRQMAVWEGRAVAEPVIVSEPEPQVQEPSDTNTKLTLVSPNKEEITQSAPLTANATETEKLARKKEQLQERLANLEKQFTIMQEMIAIKDQQLAVMQNAQVAPELKVDASLNQDNSSITNEQKEQAIPETVVDEPDAVIPPKQETNKQDSTTQPVPPANEVQQTSADSQQVDEDSGVNYFYLGTGLLVLLGFGWLLGRRRKTEEEINKNSIFSSASELSTADIQGKISVPILDQKSSYEVGESSFLSEFAPGDFDVFETDQAEVDPSSEADVYLAYGRYQQAEELMRQAITDQPEKDEYKLKLLEIFYASENEGGFENYANELVVAGKQTDTNFWSKVSAMGSELIPASALFSDGEGEAKFDLPDDDFLNASEKIANDDASSVTDEISKLSEEDNKPAEADVDSDSGALPLADSAEQSNEVNSKIDHDIESIDFDLSQFESIETPDVNESNLVDDLETFDFSSSKQVEKSEEPEATTSAENNDFDFDFDFDEATVTPDAEITMDSDANDSEVSDITDMDEFETKIDLAKAYIDMGDQAAAKEIVQEVLAQGNDAQKLEAQSILDKLS